MSQKAVLPGGFLAGSLWLGLPDCPESTKKLKKNITDLQTFWLQVSQGLRGTLNQKNL